MTAGAAAAVGAIALLLSALPALAGSPRELLPNLIQLPPIQLQTRAVRVAGTTRHELLFTSTSANTGAGPLVVRLVRRSSAAPFAVAQIVSRSDGSTRSYPVAVAIRYVSRPGHNHFHVPHFERYELRNAADRVVATDTKLGFCLGDRAPVGTAHRPARFTGPCGRGIRNALRLTVGISVGWADPYASDLDGQQLDVTGLPAGTYTLVNRVNPDGTFHESSYGDNVAAARIRLAWPNGRSAPPVVTPLASCRAERCP